jgi:hypothetical protein
MTRALSEGCAKHASAKRVASATPEGIWCVPHEGPEREHGVRVAQAMRNAAARGKLARPSVVRVRWLGGCSVASVCERAGCPFCSAFWNFPLRRGTATAATSSAAPRAQSGARHGLETVALAERRHVMALRAIRRGLSVAPSSLGREGAPERCLVRRFRADWRCTGGWRRLRCRRSTWAPGQTRAALLARSRTEMRGRAANQVHAERA